MSIVVAIKTKEGVIIGADKQVTQYNRIKSDGVNKIKRFKYSNSALGTVGMLRDCNIINAYEEIIRYKDILDKTKIDIDYVTVNIVDNLFNLMRNYKRIKTIDGIEYVLSRFLFVTSNNIFVIDRDGSVVEGDKYLTIGCGDELVKGYLDVEFSKTKKDITLEQGKELIENCIKLACKDDVYIGSDEIDFMYLKKEV